ncbi:addiction module protein [Microcoleus sp.]|uniref:addiction module protein n=1 Tax=Microcoleus sp. TaxID=44472 RepID=UPI00403EB25A
MLSIERLMKEALSLPNALRAQLAEMLVESLLELDIDGTVQKLWTVEAKQRRDEIRSGMVEPIPGEEALAQIRQIIAQ